MWKISFMQLIFKQPEAWFPFGNLLGVCTRISLFWSIYSREVCILERLLYSALSGQNLQKLILRSWFELWSSKLVNCLINFLVLTVLVTYLCSYFQEAVTKDAEDHTTEADANFKSYLADAYLHPIFHSFDEVELSEVRVDKTRPQDQTATATAVGSPSRQHSNYHVHEQSNGIQHFEVEQQRTEYQYHYEVESQSNMYRYGVESQYHVSN